MVLMLDMSRKILSAVYRSKDMHACAWRVSVLVRAVRRDPALGPILTTVRQQSG